MTADNQTPPDNGGPPDNEGPLSRWSRRKAETREKQSTAEERGDAAPFPADAPAGVPARTAPDGGAADGEEAAPPDLPDIDSLTAESDFTVFMRAGVPDQLRKLALRKLWRSDPILANVDGLVDYGEDFTDAADVVKNLKTAYQVGKGYAPDEPDEPEEPREAESEQEDVAESPEEEEGVAESPETDVAEAPAAGGDGPEAEDGDGGAIPEPGEKNPDPSGTTG